MQTLLTVLLSSSFGVSVCSTNNVNVCTTNSSFMRGHLRHLWGLCIPQLHNFIIITWIDLRVGSVYTHTTNPARLCETQIRSDERSVRERVKILDAVVPVYTNFVAFVILCSRLSDRSCGDRYESRLRSYRCFWYQTRAGISFNLRRSEERRVWQECRSRLSRDH